MLRRVPALLATSALALTALSATAPASAQAAGGNDSLASVQTSDGNTFDKLAGDFDILTEAAPNRPGLPAARGGAHRHDHPAP